MCTFSHKTQQLVARAKEGNESALNQLYRVYGERVLWMVRLRMGRELRSKLDSMDMVQDVLVNVLQGLEDFQYTNEGDFVRWLSKITQNALLDNLDKLHAGKRDIRKEVRLDGQRRTAEGGYVGTAGPIEATTPSAIMSKIEDLAKLEKAIDSLKPEYREVIVLSKIEGLSYSQIASRLGKSPDAVRMLLPSAMAELTSLFMRI